MSKIDMIKRILPQDFPHIIPSLDFCRLLALLSVEGRAGPTFFESFSSSCLDTGDGETSYMQMPSVEV